MNVFRKANFGLILMATVSSLAIAQDDPRADGWQTEAFANIVSNVLHRFSTDIGSQEPDAIVRRYFLTDHFQASFPEKESTTRQVPPFEIATGESTLAKTDDPFVVLSRLSNDWQSVAAPTFSFKIVAVEPTQRNVITEILVGVGGETSRSRSDEVRDNSHLKWEQHAQWDVTWAPSGDGHPRITELHIREITRTTLYGPTAFVDRSQAIFTNVNSYRQQLAFGQPYWLRRIEAFHGMLNPGQNGISIGDLSGDGLDDVFVCQPGGIPNRVYFQQANGTVVDATQVAGLDLLDNTHCALIVDFDNDGDQDIALATAAALLVYENMQGRFELRHADRNMSDAYSLAANDFDRDGKLDLYACGYFPNGADVHALPIPIPYFDAKNGGANRLLRNNGSFQFVDVTNTVGLDDDNRRFSYAAIWIDYDDDGDDDLYVANDFGPDIVYRAERNAERLRFVNVSDKLGIQHGAFGMSASASDVNRDGFEDIYVANMFSSAGNRVTRQSQFRPGESVIQRSAFRRLANGNSLLLNQAGSSFVDIGATSGTAMGRWSWGSNFVDINNDGWDDLLVTNGYITGETTSDL